MAYYNGKKVLSRFYNGKKVLSFVYYNVLPSTFQQVEYIESTGTQYINTGVSGECSWEVKLQFKQIETKTQIIMGRSDNAGYWFGALPSRSGGYYGFGNDNASSILATSLAVAKINTHNDAISGTVNEQTIPTRYTVSTTISYRYHLFNAPTDFNYPSYAKLYSCKTYVNNILVRDFVPCYRKSDNVIGLYDLVNDVFYTNAGSGTFIKGGNV